MAMTITATVPAIRSESESLARADVMTAAQVAELLQMPVSTVYYLARRGELPAQKSVMC